MSRRHGNTYPLPFPNWKVCKIIHFFTFSFLYTPLFSVSQSTAGVAGLH